MNVIKQLDNTSIKLPAVGQGMGEYAWDEGQVEILRAGIDLGMNFIDTAEGYDNGHSEEVIGRAIEGIRERVVIGTKFSPEHNSYNDVLRAAEGSLCRLKTDYIDLYQLHWPNPSIPVKETMSAMEELVKEGKVRHIGVCNLFLRDLQETQSALVTEKIVSLQIEYNLFDRIIEDEILPFCNCNKIMIIAYSPLDQGRISNGTTQIDLLEKMAKKYNKTPAQIALRWLINNLSVVVIPKTKNIIYLKENASSVDFDLTKKDIEEISRVCKSSLIHVLPDKIRVSTRGQGNRLVYQSIEEAKENRLGHIPSPTCLAKYITKEKAIKPVRLIRTQDKTGQFDYDLVEGRIRFWAWVIAYGNVSIPAYIREDWP